MNKSLLPFSLSSLITSLLLIAFSYCSAQDTYTTITPTQYITDPQSTTSSSEIFKLGFFSPVKSTYRYVGIWYNKIPEQTTVWVANRDNPLNDSSGVLRIADDGNLVVLDGRGIVRWTTNVSTTASKNLTAELLDSGNFVFRRDGQTVWQSFEHPTNTFLPMMNIGESRRTGKKQQLTSWKGDSDPSSGKFSAGLEHVGIPQLVVWSGSKRLWRSGPWNNRIFIGIGNTHSVTLNDFHLNKDDKGDSVYLTYDFADKSFTPRFVLGNRGELFGERWDKGGTRWHRFFSTKANGDCDVYGKCGPFGSCNKLDKPICSCLRGFMPKSTHEWSNRDWSSGCIRKTELQCERKRTSSSSSGINTTTEGEKADGFMKLKMMKVPDNANSLAASGIVRCEQECLQNCSCLAYSYDSGAGCMTWGGSLVDIQSFSHPAGVDLYIRLASSELGPLRPQGPAGKRIPKHAAKKNSNAIIEIIVLVGTFTSLGVCTCFFVRMMAKQRGKQKEDMENSLLESSDRSMIRDSRDLKLFKIEELATATNNFCRVNKLGEGGFGPVYKGRFTDGQEIAVKRLSKSSGQGLEEFKTEVLVILRLQHRNLVRLLGCCIERKEKMLIYEYMPNKSLDAFLFDPTKQSLLDWRKRFEIIKGISRGILYLHKDSTVRVIHRDLKASNILLDEELNPKISDFGTARIFEGNILQANTKRVVGTYGYMSPEYAMKGLFSEKSDVFSFGVLLLEIVSGKKNSSFHNHEASSLLGYAWKLWKVNKTQSLIDPTLLSKQISEPEILRCIHVGLLCVQEFPKDRPTMLTTLSMLTSEISTLPSAKQPAFTEQQVSSNSSSSQKCQKGCSTNNLTITEVEGR